METVVSLKCGALMALCSLSHLVFRASTAPTSFVDRYHRSFTTGETHGNCIICYSLCERNMLTYYFDLSIILNE